MSSGEKNVVGFLIGWVFVVGFLLYAVFKPAPENPHQVGPT